MMRRLGPTTRTLSVGLTIWFVWLTASVHLLHTHPLSECCDGNIAASSRAVRIDHRTSSGAAATHGATGLCPACLFLAKYMADGCPTPPRLVPDDQVPAPVAAVKAARTDALDWPSTAPRAPPVRVI
jgi:hypothetical protein